MKFVTTSFDWRRQMDGLRDVLFARDEEETIALDEAHAVTDGEDSGSAFPEA
jgi:hypothetical protein